MLSDYQLDLQYGKGDCNFVLSAPDITLDAQWRIHVDGMPYGGIVTRPCPASTADGDRISYEGVTVQGVMADHVIEPPRGKSHLSLSGDANEIISQVFELADVGPDYLVADTLPSGLEVASYSFNRYVDVWTGLRMMLASVGGRLEVECKDGGHVVRAVKRTAYGGVESERAYFELKLDKLPYNHIIALGKGEGAAREVVHWYASLGGIISKNQSLFGELKRTYVYQLNSEEGSALAAKAKVKLEELQTVSEADLSLPPGVSLDVGDRVLLSNAHYNLAAEAEVTDVVVKASLGIEDVQYKFGSPDYPKDEE